MEFIESIPKNTVKKEYSLLVKHNNLVQGKYYLEASEQKLLYKIFEEIQKRGYSTREVHIEFKDFYNDYKSILNKNITKNDFKNLIEGLQDKKAYIIKKDEYIRTQWYKIRGKLDMSEVKLILDEDVFDYVQSLDRNFTGLRLETLYSFRSFHSMRIYELLKQWSETKNEIAYEIDTLKELLGVENNRGYKNFSNFNKYVLEKAKKEINEKSEFSISIKTKKVGRSVKGVCFVIDKKEERNRFAIDDNEKSSIIENIKTKLDVEDIPYKRLFDSYSIEKFISDFGDYNFKEIKYKNVLRDSIMASLDKDDAESLCKKTYNYFKKTLENKLNDLSKKENQSELKKTKFHNFDETFTQYSEDEFEDIILKSQKKKFG